MVDDNIESFTAAKAKKTGKMEDWLPRDVLISAIARIDSGELDPNALVVVMRNPDGMGSNDVHYAHSGPDTVTTLGMLEFAKHMLLDT